MKNFVNKLDHLMWTLTAFLPLLSALTYGRYEYTMFAWSWFVDLLNTILAPLAPIPDIYLVVASSVACCFLLHCVVDFILFLPRLCQTFVRKWGVDVG
jgi:hypothetical protein